MMRAVGLQIGVGNGTVTVEIQGRIESSLTCLLAARALEREEIVKVHVAVSSVKRGRTQPRRHGCLI